LVGSVGVLVQGALTGCAFAVTVAAVFEGEDVGGDGVEEFVGGGAVGDVGGIAVESEEGEFGLIVGDPPGVEFCVVGGSQVNVLDGEIAGVPVAFEAARVVGEEDQMGFEEADRYECDYVGDQDGEEEVH